MPGDEVSPGALRYCYAFEQSNRENVYTRSLKLAGCFRFRGGDCASLRDAGETRPSKHFPNPAVVRTTVRISNRRSAVDVASACTHSIRSAVNDRECERQQVVTAGSVRKVGDH